MSVVYLAEHVQLERRVALKVISPALADDDTFRARFVRESRLAAALDHPHIVPIYDAGESDGVPYIAMRYIDGSDLAHLIGADGMLARRVARIVDQVADALGAAHAAGLVHRDVKPANVLVSTGRDGEDHCYLGDFGITRQVAAGRSLTGTGQIIGTIDYIAPEQIDGGPLDGRADVYALGCMAFECLTGQPPFARPTEMGVLVGHLRDPAPPRADSGPRFRPESTPSSSAPSRSDPMTATSAAARSPAHCERPSSSRVRPPPTRHPPPGRRGLPCPHRRPRRAGPRRPIRRGGTTSAGCRSRQARLLRPTRSRRAGARRTRTPASRAPEPA